jgi:DNA-binding GntR family transcriptional regulator
MARKPNGKARTRVSRKAAPYRSEKERIYKKLRSDIITLALAPGKLLVESALARRFGVSKAPIREALAILQRDGLVESLSRKGYLVTPITINDVHELFEIRTAIEGAAAELAATRITPREIDYLATLQPPAVGARGPALGKFLDYNREFHLAVARASRNHRLVQLIEEATDEMSRAIAASYEIGEHATILEALRAGDPTRARTAMVEHIRRSQSRALGRLSDPIAQKIDGHDPLRAGRNYAL